MCFKHNPEQGNEILFPESYFKINLKPFKVLRYGEKNIINKNNKLVLVALWEKDTRDKHTSQWKRKMFNAITAFNAFWIDTLMLTGICNLTCILLKLVFFHSLFSNFSSSLLLIYTDTTIIWPLNTFLKHL